MTFQIPLLNTGQWIFWCIFLVTVHNLCWLRDQIEELDLPPQKRRVAEARRSSMKPSRKNSKKLTWQHPEIPSIKEGEVLNATSRRSSVASKKSSFSECYEIAPERLEVVGLSPEPSNWLPVLRDSRDRSSSLPTGHGKTKLLKHFRR